MRAPHRSGQAPDQAQHRSGRPHLLLTRHPGPSATPGIRAVIPQPSDQIGHRRRRGRHGGRPRGFDREAYEQRNTVERCINRLEQWRGLATRTDKLAIAHQAALHLAEGAGGVRPPLLGAAPVRDPPPGDHRLGLRPDAARRRHHPGAVPGARRGRRGVAAPGTDGRADADGRARQPDGDALHRDRAARADAHEAQRRATEREAQRPVCKRCGQKLTDQRREETTARGDTWTAGDLPLCGTCHQRREVLPTCGRAARGCRILRSTTPSSGSGARKAGRFPAAKEPRRKEGTGRQAQTCSTAADRAGGVPPVQPKDLSRYRESGRDELLLAVRRFDLGLLVRQ